MTGLSDAASGRLVGVALTAAALGLFALVDALGLSGTARAVVFLLLAVLIVLAATFALVAWVIRRRSQPLTERPAEWEVAEEWAPEGEE